MAAISTASIHCLTHAAKWVEYGSRSAHLLEKISRLFRLTIDPVQGIAFIGYGIKEVAWDGIRQLLQKKENENEHEIHARLSRSIQWFYSKIAESHVLCGIFYAFSGISCLLQGLDTYAIIELGKLSPMIYQFSNSCFIFINIIALGHRIKLYQEIDKLLTKTEKSERRILRCLQKSILIGILSNISYLISTCTMLFGGMTAVVIICVVLGVAFGFIRMLYERVNIPLEDLHEGYIIKK